MASDNPKQTIFIKDLSTKSVTLYPSRAHIVRDINDVLLKPGLNEIEIYGLSPTIDEHSVQIDGKGAATVVDMAVELVPTREIFEDVYPDGDLDDSSVEDEEPYVDSDDEPDKVKELSLEIRAITDDLSREQETRTSCEQQIAALDTYIRSLNAEHVSPTAAKELLQSYEEERGNLYNKQIAADKKVASFHKQIMRKENEKRRAGKESRKVKAKQQAARAKARKDWELKILEKKKLAQHNKDEALRFWPNFVYRILLQLETSTVYTPSSRRSSVDSITIAESSALSPSKEGPDDGTKQNVPTETLVSLSLFYVTSEAGWAPRYDIKISSINKSAQISYQTEFTNHTSETWKDAKVSFSTSQTSYQGLDDIMPQIHPWKITLSKESSHIDFGLLSPEESSVTRSGERSGPRFDRSRYFGRDNYHVPLNGRGRFKPQIQPAPYAPVPVNFQLQAQQHVQQQAQQQAAQFAQLAQAQQQQQAGATEAHALQDYQMQLMLLEQQNKKRLVMARQEQDTMQTAAEGVPVGNPPGLVDESNTFDFSEPTWEDNGLTTTYDIPQLRTLSPSSQTRRHKIATLNASNIELSHNTIPKLRSAAFLLAKIKNPSSNITVLRGPAGVTLDGSFLGTMNIPRVSPGRVFQLSLGVDPAIQISYPKPSVKRSTQGVFTKEDAQVFTRNIWLTNTKSVPVDVIVLDQIPISEDERLRINIISPHGLVKEGDVVKAGISAREAVAGYSESTSVKKPESVKWGSAVARLKKNNEVAFTARLEPGRGCLLKLEYEARFPNSSSIVRV